MNDLLFVCDRAAVPSTWSTLDKRGDYRYEINHQGTGANLNLKIQSLPHAAHMLLSPRADDLIRIAAYVYACDQMVSRGSELDVYGKLWKRRFHLAIPVSEPNFWGNNTVRDALAETLTFASDDDWDFAFCQAPDTLSQLPFSGRSEDRWGNPDSVILLSGGADSLCATIDAVSLGARPLLVSHRPANILNRRQKDLVKALRNRVGKWEFPHISVEIHRTNGDAEENTQRTRAFLYAAMGAGVASRLGIKRVLLSDNGIVSLNLPINAQLVGALASRSTHPKFINFFNGLMSRVFPTPPIVENSLWKLTRAEALKILEAANVPDLLQETVSCAHTRGMPAAHPHCGVCSQCVDRRFGSLAADLEEHDIGERYETNIFSDNLKEGNDRTLVQSYVRFAQTVGAVDSDEALFDLYPQLHDCILPADPNSYETATTLIGLVRRHAEAVLGVLAKQIQTHSVQMARGLLPEDCLLGIISSHSATSQGNHGPLPKAHHPDSEMTIHIRNLLDEVLEIPSGNQNKADAARYHDGIFDLVQFVFDPFLRNFTKEFDIDDGSGRIDIICDNYANDGQFAQWRASLGATTIPIECKNYSGELGNAELNQLNNRLGADTSRLGFLFCRRVKSSSNMIRNAKVRWNRHNNCIVVFDDSDLRRLVSLRIDDDRTGTEKYIATKIRQVQYGSPEPARRTKSSRESRASAS